MKKKEREGWKEDIIKRKEDENKGRERERERDSPDLEQKGFWMKLSGLAPLT